MVDALKNLSEISLEGRVALVTGAARGLGRTMAFALCQAGANVVLLAKDAEAADASAHEAAGQPRAGRAMGVSCDIRNLGQCRAAVARTLEAFGGLHILVNNAALGPTHVELSTMQRGGNSPYGVTKTAIEAETLIWAQDLKNTGVTVNSLIPGGAADTDFVSARSRTQIAQTGRKLLAPDVMIAPLLWLCSTEADAVTGARYVGKMWNAALWPAEAARGALEPPVLRTPDRD